MVELRQGLGRRRAYRPELVSVGEFPSPVLALDGYLFDVSRVVLHLLHKGAKRQLLVPGLRWAGEQLINAHEHQDEQKPEQNRLMRLSQKSFSAGFYVGCPNSPPSSPRN